MDLKILKQKNIKFEILDEQRAEKILGSEYSLFRLCNLAEIFETYRQTENVGKFVDLDFAQLYFLSDLDYELSHILMRICLELELKLKTLLIADARKLGVINTFVLDYITTDYNYLSQVFPEKIKSLLKNVESGQDEFVLEKFLETITFGTFEKVVRAFYEQYSLMLFGKQSAPYDSYLFSIHNIRNKVAHNIPVISDLLKKSNSFNSRLSEYLVKKGVKAKTLHTNLSRSVVYDVANILYFYCATQDQKRITVNYKELKAFCHSCKKFKKYFRQNTVLMSSFKFFEKITIIFKSPVA